MLNCVDNSGATLVECVANLRMKRHATIGMPSQPTAMDGKINSSQGIGLLLSSKRLGPSVTTPQVVQWRRREGTESGEEISGML